MRSNIKIMNRQPEITDEELDRFKDFDSLVIKHHRILNSKRPSAWKFIIPAVMLIGIVITFSWINTEETSAVKKQSPVADTNTRPELKHVEESTNQTPAMPAFEEATVNKKPETPAQITEPAAEQKPDSVSAKESGVTLSDNRPAVPARTEAVYVQAEPVQGYEALYAYFAHEIIYPQEAIKDSIQGVLTVTFLINKEGKPEKIRTSGSLGKAFEAEAVRLIENMPLWKPATLNGQPVTSKLSIPLTFQIQKK